MYNLTVATAHTYYVGEGQWLVHNQSGRNGILEKPQGISDQKLQNITNNLYREGVNGPQVPGGTAGAVRWEATHPGQYIGNKPHFGKADQTAKDLWNLIKSGTLNERDEKIARALYKDLENALKGVRCP